MKYGSSFRIEVKGLWEDTPVYASTDITLSDSYLSTNELKRVLTEIESWFFREIRIQKRYADISDDDLVALAKARGLTVEPVAPTITLPELYYIGSKSGGTKGHYIELFSGGTIKCSCPGFVNRNKCWASTKVSESPQAYVGSKWAASRYNFYQNREADYGHYR